MAAYTYDMNSHREYHYSSTSMCLLKVRFLLDPPDVDTGGECSPDVASVDSGCGNSDEGRVVGSASTVVFACQSTAPTPSTIDALSSPRTQRAAVGKQQQSPLRSAPLVSRFSPSRIANNLSPCQEVAVDVDRVTSFHRTSDVQHDTSGLTRNTGDRTMSPPSILTGVVNVDNPNAIPTKSYSSPTKGCRPPLLASTPLPTSMREGRNNRCETDAQTDDSYILYSSPITSPSKPAGKTDKDTNFCRAIGNYNVFSPTNLHTNKSFEISSETDDRQSGTDTSGSYVINPDEGSSGSVELVI